MGDSDEKGLREANLAYRWPGLYDLMGEGDGVVGGVVGILRAAGSRPRRLLDLGCGTGRHLAELVARLGVDAVGVDLQEQLVEYGRRRYGVELLVGDMRSVRLGRTFDVITCLGNGLAYLQSEDEVEAALATVAVHAGEGAVVIISTLMQPLPEVSRRELRVENDLVMASVEVESYWDAVDGVQITERRWVHDRGGVDRDLLRRRVIGMDVLTEMLLRVGFVRVEIADSRGVVGPARTMDEFVVAFR
ncbi:class I SAM-dependent methyltransferase [Kribbella endophytica]